MRLVRTALLSLLLMACGDRADDAPAPDVAPPAEPPPAAAPADSLDARLMARGRQVYETICSECHTLEPPPTTAPTLREIMDRYHEAFPDRAEALDHLADYVREPSPVKSRLPQVMIDEWGVMPPQPLPAEDLGAVAYFIWHLPHASDTTATR